MELSPAGGLNSVSFSHCLPAAISQSEGRDVPAGRFVVFLWGVDMCVSVFLLELGGISTASS